MIWISLIFGALNLLLTWFLNNRAADVSDYDRKRAGHAMALMRKCLEAGHASGYSEAFSDELHARATE